MTNPAHIHERFFRQASFVTSGAALKGFMPDVGHEIAFVGRSNAGKSSAINAICSQKALARTSKTPGRTQLVNFFELEEHKRVVDLPGYGFAKAPKAAQAQWGKLIQTYFEKRTSLKAVVMMMDCRHPLTNNDLGLLEWFESYNLPLLVLLTKADKLKRGAQATVLLEVKKAFADDPLTSVQLFSALKKQGVEQARATLYDHLHSK